LCEHVIEKNVFKVSSSFFLAIQRTPRKRKLNLAR